MNRCVLGYHGGYMDARESWGMSLLINGLLGPVSFDHSCGQYSVLKEVHLHEGLVSCEGILKDPPLSRHRA